MSEPIKLRSFEISPKLIFSELGKKVVGQDDAKRLVATALFRHTVNCSILLSKENRVYDAMRPLPLIMGESGNGKTFMIREAVRILREIIGKPDYFPIIEIDCTQLTPNGWAGQSFSTHIHDHAVQYRSSEQDQLATTIVYLDEFDKICTPLKTSQGEDWHKETQYSLLKLIEGGVQSIQAERGGQATIQVDTSSWLFILSGNFGKFREIRDKRNDPKNGSIGFVNLEDNGPKKKNQLHAKSILQDKRVGVTTQLTGRITDIAEVQRLTDDQLKTICTQNLLPEILAFFAYIDYNISVEDIDIDEVIRRCKDLKLGARGLKGELEGILEEHLYNSRLKMEVVDN